MKLKRKIKTKTSIKCFLLTFFVSLIFSANMQAQEITVQGTITNEEDNSPIPGVSVVVQGTTRGAVSDFDGNYIIKAKIGDVLQFSYLGMDNKSVKVTSPNLNVIMTPAVEELDDIVVIGYGAIKKKELTGAVAQVKAEDIEQIVTSDLARALQGQVAGVNVNFNSGEPGEPSSIQIRGISSLTGSNNPLFVVDGIAFDEDPNINPSEIETIDVLKDAASASIYGTRGAGGVILITTRRGREGKNQISFDSSIGIQNVPTGNFVETLNTPEQIFVDLASNVASEADSSPFNLLNNTSILDDITNNDAIIQRYNLRFSGGSKDVNYSIISGYFGQKGIFGNAELNRYNLRANVRIKKKKWGINSGFGFTIDDRSGVGASGLLRNSLVYSPFFPSIDEVQEFAVSGQAANRVRAVLGSLTNKNDQDRYRLDVNTQINYQITPSLQFVSTVGAGITHSNRSQANRPFRITAFFENLNTISQGFVIESTARRIVLNSNAGLNYNKTFGKKHSLKGTFLVSSEKDTNVSFAVRADGLIDNGLSLLSNTTDGVVATSNAQIPRLINGGFINPDFQITRIGTIARILYDYDKKYLLNISARRDGSSQFGENNRWATFPSVSVAWNIAEEEFWAPFKSVVNNFKYRASYGTTGNDRIPSFSFLNARVPSLNTVFGDPSALRVGGAQVGLSNPDVKWETTKQYNFGFDLGFFRNKVTFTADYYTTQKEDLLLRVVNPGSSGTTSSTPKNVGNMTNVGIEYALRYRGNSKSKKFKWNIGATYTKNSNVVTQLNGDTDFIFLAGSTQLVQGNPGVLVLQKGEEAGSFWLFRTAGVIRDADELLEYRSTLNPDVGNTFREGDLRYVDVNGDGRINDDDREIRGSGLPEFEIGLNINLSYKNLSLTSNWYASSGNEVLNGSRATAFSERRNRDLLFQWTPTNRDATLPIWRARRNEHRNYSSNTDLFLEDGSYIRLNNVQLAYNFPKKWLKGLSLNSASLFVSGQNLVTFSGYSGYDPGVGGNSITRRGVDATTFPLSSQYNIGFKFNF